MQGPNRFNLVLMLAPATLVLGGLFAGGLALGLLESIGVAGLSSDGFTTEHYLALLSDREFRASLGFSFAMAAIATLLSTVFGVAMALAIHHHRKESRLARMLIQFPVAMPHLAIAMVVIHLLAPSGLLARGAYAAGWIGEPAEFPAVIQDAYGIGILVAYVWKETPFLAVVALAMLARTGEEYDLCARTLGATTWQRLRYVTLPLIAPGVISASLIALAFVFSSFETPFLLGRPYPAMLGVVAQRRFMSADLADRPAALALALAMAVVTAAAVWLYLKLAERFVGERPAVF
ncbi:MAG: ABC transporter permease [Bryobacteraceae bacterium]